MANYNGFRSTWTIQDGIINLQSTGIPYHSYGTASSLTATNQKYDISFKYRGGLNSRGRAKTIGEGVIGYMMNGVALYSPSTSTSAPIGYPLPPNGYKYNRSYAQSTNLNYSFNEDYAGGYTTPGLNGLGGIYHYQDSSFTNIWFTSLGSTTGTVGDAELSVIPYYSNTLLHPDGHSKILGWALDGYPIYGPYGYAGPKNPLNGIRTLNTGYKLKDSSYRTGITTDLKKFPMGIFVEDYEFVKGDLDKHNGRYCVTPDFPQGTYAYFVTVDSNLLPVYPYVIGNTFYGDVQIVTKTPINNDTQPQWQTPAGNLGSYVANTYVGINLLATPIKPATTITYTLISGSLPAGLTLDSTGVITGNPRVLAEATMFNFTVRATDEFNNFRDRSFYINIPGQEYPSFDTPTGNILYVMDSTWVSYQIQYTNTIPGNIVRVELLQGTLPPGLEINEDGLIRGYALPPKDAVTGAPLTATFDFSLMLLSSVGTNDIREFSITVQNQNQNKVPNTRIPAVLNNKPLTFDIANDIYYGYYTTGTNNYLGEIDSGDEFYFKILGHDFDGQSLYYEFANLPLGLVGNSVTGWITGNPTLNSKGLNEYSFKARVGKISNVGIYSQFVNFTFRVNNKVSTEISWISPESLGSISNGSISNLKLVATSIEKINYRLVDGNLPTNLSLLSTGEVVGRVPFQPDTTIVQPGDSTDYTFTVEAFSTMFPLVSSKKTFTLRVVQDFDTPVETAYFKATPSLEDRAIIKSLLTDTSLIPNSYLYRPEDPYYGKATDIKCAFAFGMDASSVTEYLASTNQNFYWKNITLGELKTAQARDENNNVIYEVVYSQIIDDLTNPAGTSVSKMVRWKTPISLQKGPWLVNNTYIYANWDFDKTYITSLTPEYIYQVYPNSLDNMQKQLSTVIPQNTSSDLLPLWMTSQQENGSTLGFTKAWVIAYTIPGKAEEIKNNINSNWQYKLNQINFRLDRFVVDKSATYDWNTDLAIPAWSTLPSGTPVPDPEDSKDFYVLFPRQTILPDSNQS